jgi:ribosomal protein S18 acetylase RimI-like enzyme
MRGIKVIATHADNGAIGFYEKMGFSLTEFIENRHLGEQQFSDSTIMQTRINQQIDYFHLR